MQRTKQNGEKRRRRRRETHTRRATESNQKRDGHSGERVCLCTLVISLLFIPLHMYFGVVTPSTLGKLHSNGVLLGRATQKKIKRTKKSINWKKIWLCLISIYTTYMYEYPKQISTISIWFFFFLALFFPNAMDANNARIEFAKPFCYTKHYTFFSIYFSYSNDPYSTRVHRIAVRDIKCPPNEFMLITTPSYQFIISTLISQQLRHSP